MDEKRIAELEQNLEMLMTDEQLFLLPEISLSMLSFKMKTNPNYLSQLFNHQLHTNFNGYINRLRVEYACKLLNNASVKDLPVQTIWRRVGFATRSTFYEAFKKHSSKTPSAFRESSEKEENLTVTPRKN